MNWSAAWFYEKDDYAGFGPQAYLGATAGPTTGTISGGTGGPFLLKSLLASSASGATTLSLTNNGTGESANLVLATTNTPVILTTGWTNHSTSVNVTSSDGFNLAIDNLRFSR